MDVSRREYLRAALAVHGSAAAVLGGICDLCVEEVGVTGARIRVLGVTSADSGGALVYSSDALGVLLEDLAITVGVGPCIDAFALGRPVLVPDLNEVDVRWPGFTAEAIAAGAVAVFSFPLQAGGIRLGVLDLYRDSAGSLTPAHLADVLLVADIATDTIFHDLKAEAPMTLSGLVDVQIEVHQATGMVAVDLQVSLPEALLRIRGHAFVHHLRLAEVAKDIVERRLRIDNGGVT